MGKSKIDWLDGGETINPFTGCRQGCAFCYARRMAHRLAHIDGTVYRRVGVAMQGRGRWHIPPVGGNPFHPAVHFDVFAREERRLGRTARHGCIGAPRRLSTRRVFVGSMGDLCLEGLAATFAVDGSLLPQAAWYNTRQLQHRLAHFAARVAPHTVLLLTKRPDLLVSDVEWPLNVHMGVSVTGNVDAHRTVELHHWYGHADADTPWNEHKPGVLWASIEPLLDPDFAEETFIEGLDWVVVGAQTGPGAAKKMARITGWERGSDGVVRDKTERDVLVAAAWRIVMKCHDLEIPCFVKDNLIHMEPGRMWPREFPVGR